MIYETGKNEYAEDEIQLFDDWVKIRTVQNLTKLKKMKNALDRAISHTKTQDVSEAIQRRSYMMDLIKIKKLTSICAERRRTMIRDA